MEEEKETRSKSRKKKKSKLLIFILLIIIIVVIVCSVIFISKPKENHEQNKLEKGLLGSWTTDGYTVYEFYEDGNGALKIPMSDYTFSYTIDENKVSIDFENEKSIDSDYEFSFEDEKLILKGINKTSGTYTFTKNEN